MGAGGGAGGKAAEKPAKGAAGRARLPVERARWAVVSSVVAVALILAAFRFLSPITALETRLSDTPNQAVGAAIERT